MGLIKLPGSKTRFWVAKDARQVPKASSASSSQAERFRLFYAFPSGAECEDDPMISYPRTLSMLCGFDLLTLIIRKFTSLLLTYLSRSERRARQAGVQRPGGRGQARASMCLWPRSCTRGLRVRAPKRCGTGGNTPVAILFEVPQYI